MLGLKSDMKQYHCLNEVAHNEGLDLRSSQRECSDVGDWVHVVPLFGTHRFSTLPFRLALSAL